MKEFIDEFKHLEKLCNEIYAERHGVTQYINEMEQKSGFPSIEIAGWNNDLAKLKRVRYIRNNLVHESDYEIDYDESDIAFLRDFYKRILAQQDPLALLRKKREQITQTKPRPRENEVTYQPYNYNDQRKDSADGKNLVKGFLIGLGIVVSIGLLLFVAMAMFVAMAIRVAVL